MKRFYIIPAAYIHPYETYAEKFGTITTEMATLVDQHGSIIAVIPLKNVAAVYQDTDEGHAD